MHQSLKGALLWRLLMCGHISCRTLEPLRCTRKSHDCDQNLRANAQDLITGTGAAALVWTLIR